MTTAFLNFKQAKVCFYSIKTVVRSKKRFCPVCKSIRSRYGSVDPLGKAFAYVRTLIMSIS